jgi:pre-rRNA-processing protein TSR3
MNLFLPTLILRHKKENLKKCSLRGLEGREDFLFFTYPLKEQAATPSGHCRWEDLDFSNYLLLSIEGEEFRPEDTSKGLFLIDATWRYAKKMEAFVDRSMSIERRSIPKGFRTAYPRCQEECPDPEVGLASIEALYIAYHLLKRPKAHLLDHYYWKELFLEKNNQLFS